MVWVADLRPLFVFGSGYFPIEDWFLLLFPNTGHESKEALSKWQLAFLELNQLNLLIDIRCRYRYDSTDSGQPARCLALYKTDQVEEVGHINPTVIEMSRKTIEGMIKNTHVIFQPHSVSVKAMGFACEGYLWEEEKADYTKEYRRISVYNVFADAHRELQRRY
jgi:hypothetical protein